MGKHTCLYYDSEKSLLDLLHYFFKEGLQDNRLCIWVVPEWLGIEGSKAALRERIAELDTHIDKNRFIFVSHHEVYLKHGKFDHDMTLGYYEAKEKEAIELGLNGLCVCGDASFADDADWSNVTAYEMAADKLINQKNITALCAYPAKKFDIVNMFSLCFSHDLILRRGDDAMEVLIDKREFRK